MIIYDSFGEPIPGTVVINPANSQPIGVAKPFTQASVPVAVAAAQVLAASLARSFLSIQNTGTAVVYVGFDGAPTAASLQIPAGGMWSPNLPPSNAIWLMGAAASTAVVVTG